MTTTTIQHCGIAQSGEEGYCAHHLAVLLGIPKPRVDYLRATGALEFWPARTMTCGTRPKGPSICQIGDVLAFQDGAS